MLYKCYVINLFIVYIYIYIELVYLLFRLCLIWNNRFYYEFIDLIIMYMFLINNCVNFLN